ALRVGSSRSWTNGPCTQNDRDKRFGEVCHGCPLSPLNRLTYSFAVYYAALIRGASSHESDAQSVFRTEARTVSPLSCLPSAHAQKPWPCVLRCGVRTSGRHLRLSHDGASVVARCRAPPDHAPRRAGVRGLLGAARLESG